MHNSDKLPLLCCGAWGTGTVWNTVFLPFLRNGRNRNGRNRNGRRTCSVGNDGFGCGTVETAGVRQVRGCMEHSGTTWNGSVGI